MPQIKDPRIHRKSVPWEEKRKRRGRRRGEVRRRRRGEVRRRKGEEKEGGEGRVRRSRKNVDGGVACRNTYKCLCDDRA